MWLNERVYFIFDVCGRRTTDFNTDEDEGVPMLIGLKTLDNVNHLILNLSGLNEVDPCSVRGLKVIQLVSPSGNIIQRSYGRSPPGYEIVNNDYAYVAAKLYLSLNPAALLRNRSALPAGVTAFVVSKINQPATWNTGIVDNIICFAANRKGPQAGTSGATGFGLGSSTGTSLFGSTAQSSTGLFGQTTANANENKRLFGPIGGGFGQPASTGFGVTANQQQSSFLAKPFGSATTTGFGSTSTDANNPFAAKTAAPSLFDQSTVASAVPAFGQTNTGFGSFGNTANTQQQQPSLFGQTGADANEPTFALGTGTAANRGLRNFGNTATNISGGRLFGSKPGTNVGVQTD
uniref:Uncharacterized protein n=1 Tax=Glossina morsitans morsitans TaxID=37546 RepID=A0A1B0G7C3_GLOMM